MNDRSQLTVDWLLGSSDPSVRYFTLTDLLDRSSDDEDVQAAKSKIPRGPIVKTLLTGQRSAGDFGVHPYQKWTGAHWRLVSLVELGIPSGFKPAVKATDGVLKWLLGDAHLGNVPKINRLYRRCASQEGNALAVCSRLGMADDSRVKKLAYSLLEWQWPDGGWNCDRKPGAHHSSFNESLSTMWGLTEYSKITGDSTIRKAVNRVAEFFLKHRIFKSCRTDQTRPPETFHGEIFRVVHSITQIHYPTYWHYDILQALIMLDRAGKLNDERTREAVDLIVSKQNSNGLWTPDDFYWSLKRKGRSKVATSNLEIVDWGRKEPNKFLTLNALRILKATRRL